MPVTFLGATGRAMKVDGLLPTGRGPRGSQTFEAWLARHVADTAPAAGRG